MDVEKKKSELSKDLVNLYYYYPLEVERTKEQTKRVAKTTQDPKVDIFKIVTRLDYYYRYINNTLYKMQVINKLMHIFTAEEWNMINLYIIKGLHIDKCAELTGVSPRTFFRYMEKLEKKYKEARNQNGGNEYG